MKKLKILPLLLLANIAFVGATVDCSNPNATNATSLCNPTQQFAGSLPQFGEWVVMVLGWAIALTVIANLLFSGFQMIISQGNEEQVSKAKTSFQWTLFGFILAQLAFVLIYAVGDFVGVGPGGPGGTKGIEDLNPITSPSFGDLLTRMIERFLGLIGLVTLVLIVLSGFRLITARGDEEQVSQAKKGLQWAVIGFIVVSLTYVIVVASAKLLGNNVTT